MQCGGTRSTFAFEDCDTCILGHNGLQMLELTQAYMPIDMIHIMVEEANVPLRQRPQNQVKLGSYYFLIVLSHFYNKVNKQDTSKTSKLLGFIHQTCSISSDLLDFALQVLVVCDQKEHGRLLVLKFMSQGLLIFQQGCVNRTLPFVVATILNRTFLLLESFLLQNALQPLFVNHSDWLVELVALDSWIVKLLIVVFVETCFWIDSSLDVLPKLTCEAKAIVDGLEHFRHQWHPLLHFDLGRFIEEGSQVFFDPIAKAVLADHVMGIGRRDHKSIIIETIKREIYQLFYGKASPNSSKETQLLEISKRTSQVEKKQQRGENIISCWAYLQGARNSLTTALFPLESFLISNLRFLWYIFQGVSCFLRFQLLAFHFDSQFLKFYPSIMLVFSPYVPQSPHLLLPKNPPQIDRPDPHFPFQNSMLHCQENSALLVRLCFFLIGALSKIENIFACT